MNPASNQTVVEWAELSEFAVAVMDWVEYPTESGRDYLARRARKLSTVMRRSDRFAQFADWLDQDQADESPAR
jgi:hypothetical protein